MSMQTNNWSILIVDDEELIHENLKMNLRDIKYEGRGVEFIHANSADEAKSIMKSNPEIAVMILDVMMEEDIAGLDFVKFVRNEIKNNDVRILLHTGQPGIAPKKEVAAEYMIDAYLDKNVTDNNDSYAAVVVALRAYKERLDLKNSKTDTELLKEIATNYINLLKNYNLLKFEELVLKINSMVHSSQEILASYPLQDLKKDQALGTTKSQRLSFEEYSSLIQLHNIKIILTQIPADRFSKEKVIIFDNIINAARSFSHIRILPELSKGELKEYLNYKL